MTSAQELTPSDPAQRRHVVDLGSSIHTNLHQGIRTPGRGLFQKSPSGGLVSNELEAGF